VRILFCSPVYKFGFLGVIGKMKAEEMQNPDVKLTDAGKVKQINVTMLDSESLISPPVAREARESQQVKQDFSAVHYPNQNARHSSNGKRTLLAAAGIIILLCAGIFAALFFNRREQPAVSQQTTPETSVVKTDVKTEAEIPSSSQPILETSKDSKATTQTDSVKTEDSATVLTKNNPSSIQPKSEIQSSTFEKPQTYEADGNTQADLNASLSDWISATNERNVEKQMTYYAPKVNSFYRARNASVKAVRDEKKRVFDGVDAVDIQAGKPNITLSADGQTATMRFRKKYSIKKGQQNRNGEVIQEMKWVKSKNGWRIVSERDVKVIN
jgi:ketosteroid isomerase-like protein